MAAAITGTNGAAASTPTVEAARSMRRLAMRTLVCMTGFIGQLAQMV
jgi:N-acetylglutamate synthase/N-acetylornithine aminotransferase